jgi:hypothetical protein
MQNYRLSDFQLIYNAAQTNDEIALRKLIFEDGLDVDIKENEQTPASRLAAEKNITAITLLLKYGARRNSLVQILAQHGIWKPPFPHDILFVAYGLGLGKQYNLIPTFLKQYSANTNTNLANYIAYGLAQAGDKDGAEKLITENNADVTWLMQGAAQGGHTNHVKELINKHQNKSLIHIALIYAALGKQTALFDELINQYRDSIKRNMPNNSISNIPIVQLISLAAILTGNAQFATTIKEKITSYCDADFLRFMDTFNPDTYKDFFDSSPPYCCFTDINTLCIYLGNGCWTKDYLRYLRRISYSFIAVASNGNEKVIPVQNKLLQTLAFIPDDKKRCQFFNDVNKDIDKKFEDMDKKFEKILLKRATKINKLMRQGLNYYQAKEWLLNRGLRNAVMAMWPRNTERTASIRELSIDLTMTITIQNLAPNLTQFDIFNFCRYFGTKIANCSQNRNRNGSHEQSNKWQLISQILNSHIPTPGENPNSNQSNSPSSSSSSSSSSSNSPIPLVNTSNDKPNTSLSSTSPTNNISCFFTSTVKSQINLILEAEAALARATATISKYLKN